MVLTRNRPGPLKRCLASIERLRSDHIPFEVIVVDDGSDPPVGVAEGDFQSLKIHTVHLEHSGVAAARNAGIKESAGDFVGFIADDYVLPEGFLMDINRFFHEYPAAQVISHNIDPRGPLLFRPVQQLYFELSIGQAVPPQQADCDLIYSFTLPASRAAMFRREVFEKVGVFDESLRVGEDGEFGKRMALAGIPIYLFRHKRVSHFDARTSADYFRQRLRYGRSFIRSGVSGISHESLPRRKLIAMMAGMLLQKLRQWWRVSTLLGLRFRYLALSPFLFLFLCFFYFGAYAECRALSKADIAASKTGNPACH